jgi:hypothetical protein
MRHFRSRHGCSPGKTIVYVELAITAFFEWRAHAGACDFYTELRRSLNAHSDKLHAEVFSGESFL